MAAAATRRWQLVSFDLDGTLVDSAGEIAAAANRALAAAGLPPQPVAVVAGFVGGGNRELMRRLLAHLAGAHPQGTLPLDAGALFERFAAHYAALAGTQARAYPGALETLAALRAGGVRLACVTNKEMRFVAPVLRGAGLEGAFDLVVGGDSLPERKPHAGVLAHVCATLGVAASAAAHVGDSRVDVESARNAGVAAWAVPWGYGGEPVEAAFPQRVFDTLPAIARCVLEENA